MHCLIRRKTMTTEMSQNERLMLTMMTTEILDVVLETTLAMTEEAVEHMNRCMRIRYALKRFCDAAPQDDQLFRTKRRHYAILSKNILEYVMCNRKKRFDDILWRIQNGSFSDVCDYILQESYNMYGSNGERKRTWNDVQDYEDHVRKDVEREEDKDWKRIRHMDEKTWDVTMEEREQVIASMVNNGQDERLYRLNPDGSTCPVGCWCSRWHSPPFSDDDSSHLTL